MERPAIKWTSSRARPASQAWPSGVVTGVGGLGGQAGHNPVRVGRPTMGSLAAVAPICAEAPIFLTISIRSSKTLFITIYLSQENHLGNPELLSI